jgi:hypothetical protein
MDNESTNRKRIVDQPDFRTYEPYWADAGNGESVLLQHCEELDPESGRWEPFLATLKRRKNPPEK